MTGPRVVLVGAPGAGKTTVGTRLAERLGVGFLDTDQLIEQQAGKAIPEIFYDDGEEHFRALEVAAVATALATHDGVLALGGGAILSDRTRAALRAHEVVHLRVGAPDAAARVGLGVGRPVLALNPRATLKYLLDERAPLYAAVATHVVDTDGRTPDAVVEDIMRVLGAAVLAGADGERTPVTRIPVRPPGDPDYQVVLGAGVVGELASLVAGSTRVLMLAAAPVAPAAAQAAKALRESGIRVEVTELPDGEAAKDIAVAERAWAQLGAMNATRDDTVVGFGGGAVTDVAGFVAATWLRGVRVVQVPTTVAAMVDAAIGGKTGINTGAGKNLVGAFHQPAGVLCDLELLATLPAADFAAGLAEVAKGGFIADPAIVDLLEADPTGRADFRELAERKIRVKAEVVSADPKESGRREFLNYGHTLAHAIERRENYTWRHGDAVSVGLVFAAELGRLSGRLDAATAARHRALLDRMGLPTGYDPAAWPELHELMRIDKKSRADRLRFVVLDGLARPGILDDPDPDMVAAAYRAVGADR